MFKPLFVRTAITAGALLLSLVVAKKSHASAIAYLDKPSGTFVVESRFYFYGDQAKAEIVQQAVDEIDRMWNEPQVVYISQGKEHPVRFKLSYTIQPPSPKKERSLFPSITMPRDHTYVYNPYAEQFDENGELKVSSPAYLHMHPELNLINVIANDKKYDNRSNYNCGGQHGEFITSDELGVSTTAAHEFGHGLGLGHVQGNICLGADGAPSIMCARGSITRPEFQYDPKAKAGKAGGTLNPFLRKVLVDDVLSLQLPKIPVNKDGIKIVGPHLAAECRANKI